jgi:hypothetical protein
MRTMICLHFGSRQMPAYDFADEMSGPDSKPVGFPLQPCSCNAPEWLTIDITHLP